MKKKHGIFAALGVIVISVLGYLFHKPIEGPQVQITPIDSIYNQPVLYGFNANLSNSPVNYSNELFRQAIAQLHPQIIRWPGGSVSNNFNPLTGTADNGSGTPNKLEDLALLVKEDKCEVMFVLNMLTHTLDENLAALRKAESLGIPVHYVELGNEYNNINSPGRSVYATAMDYATAAAFWIDSIKAEFPLVEFGAVGENKGYKGAGTWNEDVLKILSSYHVHLVYHCYPNPNDFIYGSGQVDLHKLDSCFFDDLHITGFDQQKDFWCTEFNVKNSDKLGATAYIEPGQWIIALQHLAKLLTDADAKILCVHNIIGKEGVFSVSKKEIVLGPTGEAFKTFRQGRTDL